MSFWCFVFLSRCLIYKVHAQQLFSCQCAIFWHTLFRLSSTFFRSFSLLTQQHSHSSSFALVEELVYFTTLFRVCQELFSSFFEVFNLESLDFSPFSTTSALPSELIQFTTRFSLCQALFSSPARSPSSFRSVSSHFSTRFSALS